MILGIQFQNCLSVDRISFQQVICMKRSRFRFLAGLFKSNLLAVVFQIANVTVLSTSLKVNKKPNSVPVKASAIPNTCSYKISHLLSNLGFCE